MEEYRLIHPVKQRMEKIYIAYVLLSTFCYLRKTSNEKETNIELYYDRRTHLVMEARQKTIIQMYYYDRRIHSTNSNISKTKRCGTTTADKDSG